MRPKATLCPLWHSLTQLVHAACCSVLHNLAFRPSSNMKAPVMDTQPRQAAATLPCLALPHFFPAHAVAACGRSAWRRESFFAFCTNKRGGYSGTATFCRSAATVPVAAEAGLCGTVCEPSPQSAGAAAGCETLRQRRVTGCCAATELMPGVSVIFERLTVMRHVFR